MCIANVCFFFFTTESQFAYIASTLENIQLADSITVPRERPLVGQSVPSNGAKRRDQQEILPISSTVKESVDCALLRCSC